MLSIRGLSRKRAPRAVDELEQAKRLQRIEETLHNLQREIAAFHPGEPLAGNLDLEVQARLNAAQTSVQKLIALAKQARKFR